jgi:phenylpyruvate tautomerase PptA (4-oxalocrotonate tautomerase family)
MPIVRIEMPPGYPLEQKEMLRQAVKVAVIEALAPKETRYIYVAIGEAHGRIGDGLPTVTVDLRPGREAARKATLANAIAGCLSTHAGIVASDVYLLFRESEAANHYCGGTPLAEWTPADA